MYQAALVVQDDSAVRRLIRMRLEQAGVTVVEASTARQALAIYTARPETIGVIVSGTRLVGMDGDDLLHAVREADPEVPVLFFTSSPPAADPLPAKVAVFGKPHGLGDLLKEVRRLILAA